MIDVTIPITTIRKQKREFEREKGEFVGTVCGYIQFGLPQESVLFGIS
jgi:hypothetical protein